MRSQISTALRGLGISLIGLIAWAAIASAQSWVVPVLPVPFNVGIALQLTDGTILLQDFDSAAWWLLIPDEFGKYYDGVFFPVGAIPLKYSPDYFASAVLSDGHAIVEGGEYNNLNGSDGETTKGAIYDPTTFSWTVVKPPTGWNQIGDAPGIVTNFGGKWTFMLGNINNTVRVAGRRSTDLDCLPRHRQVRRQFRGGMDPAARRRRTDRRYLYWRAVQFDRQMIGDFRSLDQELERRRRHRRTALGFGGRLRHEAVERDGPCGAAA